MDIVTRTCHDNEYSHRRPPIINQICVGECTFIRPAERPIFFTRRVFFFTYILKNEAKN